MDLDPREKNRALSDPTTPLTRAQPRRVASSPFPEPFGPVTSEAPSSWAYGFEQRAARLGVSRWGPQNKGAAPSTPGPSGPWLRRGHVPLCISCVRSSSVGAMMRQQPTMHHTSPQQQEAPAVLLVNMMIDTSQTLSRVVMSNTLLSPQSDVDVVVPHPLASPDSQHRDDNA